MPPVQVPAVEGWFSTGPEPALLGSRCGSCSTVFFPPTARFCRNPACAGETFETVRLSRLGRIWSYTDAQYQPPPPYRAPSEPYQPFAIAAVELEAEQLVVLGMVADGFGARDLQVGAAVELVVEALWTDADGEHLGWKWRPVR